MKLVWCSWKDIKHPEAGGAEQVTHHLLKRLVADGHEVMLLTSHPNGAPAEDKIDGYRVVRNGNRFGVYWQTRQYFKKHLAGWPDVVIDEINTIPFFARTYSGAPTFVFIHQLAREVWFYQMPWPVNRVGYALEPLYLRRLRDMRVFTVSDSTKQELVSLGFAAEKIQTVRLGIETPPLKDLKSVQKYDAPTLLSFGSVRPMKRTADIVAAFDLAKAKVPKLQLIIAGNMNGPYGERVRTMAEASPNAADIQMLGSVPDAERPVIMQRAHVLAAASVKEGWGLIVTEANSQGTPAVAYDVDGLRDSVQDGKTGTVTAVNPAALAEGIAQMFSDPKRYETMRQAAWQDSKQHTYDTTYRDFTTALKGFLEAK